jgi:CheY-like chemotaxis protein
VRLVNRSYISAAAFSQTISGRRQMDSDHQSIPMGRIQTLQKSTATFGVVVADDDPMIRSVLRATLEAIGVSVFVTSNGQEAVELASRVQVSLIILDLMMPRMNGLAACHCIRKQPGNAKTPIVILTSTVGEDTEAEASRVGATAYFVKPFRPALLLQALSQYLPISDAVRAVISRDADRVNGITQPASAPVRVTRPTRSASGDMLDRNKNILNVLRG